MDTVLKELGALSPEKFSAVVLASPRKFREELFRQVGIKTKAKGSAFALGSGGKKNEARIEKLRVLVADGAPIPEQFVEEITRNYLYTLRPLLGAALDFFEVEHEDGLTENDIDFVREIEPKKGTQLKKKLEADFEARDVALYFAFMGIPTK